MPLGLLLLLLLLLTTGLIGLGLNGLGVSRTCLATGYLWMLSRNIFPFVSKQNKTMIDEGIIKSINIYL